MSSDSKAYKGSCHCGAIQYQVKLSFPPASSPEDISHIRVYKCNCTTCQKMGLFHCRPVDMANDFIMTSPSSPDELGVYRTGSKKLQWYFCKNCGVHPFTLGGKWEQVELDVAEWIGEGKSDGEGGKEKEKVWMVRPEGEFTMVKDGKEAKMDLKYLSVNVVTLEMGEGGVDLVEWHDKGWVKYVENKERAGGVTAKSNKPFPCGMY